MDQTTYRTERAVVLWLSGARFEHIQSIPEVQGLLKRGALVELNPLPITGRRAQHLQLLSGRQPGGFGFFDTLSPQGYVVKEDSAPRGTAKLLPDQLLAAGWAVRYSEISLAELSAQFERAIASFDTAPCLLMLKCEIPATTSEDEHATLAEVLRRASAWVGDAGLLAVVSDGLGARAEHLRRYVNMNNFLAAIEVIERDEQRGAIDWSNSLAYSIGHGQLWINRLGREPRGIVASQEEYDEIRDTLVKVLPARCRDEQTGEPVIERIYRKEELYAADYQFCAPDLVIVYKPDYAPSARSTRLEFDDTVFTSPVEGEIATEGIHPSQATGFAIISAPAIQPGARVADHAALTEFAPTLLYALGVTLAAMESAPIEGLFVPSYLASHAPAEEVDEQELSEEEEEQVMGRLRDLGYI